MFGLQFDAEVADLVARLDEGTPDIVRADDTQLERNARFLRVTDRRGRSRIGHRDHQVGIDRIFAREFGADRLAYRIDARPVADRIGAREIDIFEDARQNGGAWWRGRVGRYVKIVVGAVAIK